MVPALTDQSKEMAGACNRAKQMEEGLAAAASQAAQQQRRVEQLERGALSEVRPYSPPRAPLVSPVQTGDALPDHLLKCLFSFRRRHLPRDCLLASRQAGTGQTQLWVGSSQLAAGCSGPWIRQQGLPQR